MQLLVNCILCVQCSHCHYCCAYRTHCSNALIVYFDLLALGHTKVNFWL